MSLCLCLIIIDYLYTKTYFPKESGHKFVSCTDVVILVDADYLHDIES